MGGLEKPYYVYEIDEANNVVRRSARDARVTHVQATDAHLMGIEPGEVN